MKRITSRLFPSTGSLSLYKKGTVQVVLVEVAIPHQVTKAEPD